MKVLWVTNIPLPEASLLMNESVSVLGGWMTSISQEISHQGEIHLTIAFPKKGVKDFVKLEGSKINYYAFKPGKDDNRSLIKSKHILKDIIEQVNPDIIHIHGTELQHAYAAASVCETQNRKMVISVQGIVSVITVHARANLPCRTICGFTLRNLLKGDNVIGLQNLYRKRGRNEIVAIRKANHIIGRTRLDRAWSYQVNPSAHYYQCNESLRKEFYKNRWEIDKCERYSIFISQGQYAIKGLHYVIEAMPLILQRFPKCKIYVAGKNIVKSDTLKDVLFMTYYGKYIRSLIKKYTLEQHIVFEGQLNEQEMCLRYLKSNVFVCPSSIENSPNSLAEAMVLGVPCIASYVGGIPDMLKHGKEGFLYQVDAHYMLAYYICEIFQKEDVALRISENARKRAHKTHSVEMNTKRLLEIYEEILAADY